MHQNPLFFFIIKKNKLLHMHVHAPASNNICSCLWNHDSSFCIIKKSPSLSIPLPPPTYSFSLPCPPNLHLIRLLSQVSLGVHPWGERDPLQWPWDSAHRKRAGLHAPRCQNTGGDTAAIWGKRATLSFKEEKKNKKKKHYLQRPKVAFGGSVKVN